MTVLWERPSRRVRCSKYNGRTGGAGAVARARLQTARARMSHHGLINVRHSYSCFGTATPVPVLLSAPV